MLLKYLKKIEKELDLKFLHNKILFFYLFLFHYFYFLFLKIKLKTIFRIHKCENGIKIFIQFQKKNIIEIKRTRNEIDLCFLNNKNIFFVSFIFSILVGFFFKILYIILYILILK